MSNLSLFYLFANLRLGTLTVTFVHLIMFAIAFYRHALTSWHIDHRRHRHRFSCPVMTLVALRGLIRGSTVKQLRVHDESDVDGALPPPVPWRHLVLKKERQMWTSGKRETEREGERRRPPRGCSFSRRFKLSGQFQLSGAKGSPLDKSGSSDAPRVPSDEKKRMGEREARCPIAGGRYVIRKVVRIRDYS